ncbi:MAG TPA: response regulator [Nitrospirae bacterium]|nr:response regulator [Nitrospirota bacterium]
MLQFQLRRGMLMTKENILVIDDELAPRESIRMVLKDKYTVSTATGAHEGLDMMSEKSVDLVVMDIKMPVMDGITALQQIKKKHPDTEVVLLTAYASLDTARDAIRFGAFDYLLKPFDKDNVLLVVEKGLKKRRANKGLQMERDILLDRATYLEEQVDSARSNIMKYYEGTVEALNSTIDAKDHYTFNHSSRVAQLSSQLAAAFGVDEKTTKEIKHAASIHDIGKVGIEENILNKNGKLTDDEYELIKKHPVIGARIIQSIPFLEEAIPVVLYHHERYDGKGYPEGIEGENIPLVARIVGVADAVDAMMSDRPYRDALSIDKVSNELKRCSGIQFDSKMVDLILSGKVSLVWMNNKS